MLQAYLELCAWLGRTPAVQAVQEPTPTVPTGVLASIVKRFGDASKIRMENDRLVVSGIREIYEIDVLESRIVRRSDGRPVRLELDFSQPALAMLRPMMDSQDLSDPFRPNYLRLMVCAPVLLRDDINAASIVVESV